MAQQTDRDAIAHKKFVDYKDVQYLRSFMSPHAKILSKKRSNVSAARQREIALAVKRARFMALLPYLAS